VYGNGDEMLVTDSERSLTLRNLEKRSKVSVNVKQLLKNCEHVQIFGVPGWGRLVDYSGKNVDYHCPSPQSRGT
jgi:hypothetical protein